MALLLTLRVHAQWPQFRGPDGQGHSSERGLPLEWSESRNVVWKTPVAGRGWSSPVVAGGRVWLTTAIVEKGAKGASLRALAFDVDTGREAANVEVFRLRNGDLTNPKNSHASPTPLVEDDRVYVHFGADGTAALTITGDIVWKTRLPYESQHGNGGSPVLYEDLLIVSGDGSDEAFVVALDKRTGKVRWKTSRRQPWDQAYSTPLVIRVGDRNEVVSVGAFRAAAYDPQSGKEIWRVSYGDGFSNVPRPVYGHGLVYITTGFQQPSLLAVRADGSGDVTKTHIAWTLRRGAPLTPSPLLVGNELYIVNDGGLASCLDARTGETRWVQRLGGAHSASPVLADGKIYFLSEEGVTTVIAPGTEFRQLAINRLDGDTIGSMAVAGGSLFIRTASHLYRLGVNPQTEAGAVASRIPAMIVQVRKGSILVTGAVIAAAMLAVAVPRMRSSTRIAKTPDVAACPADAKPANLNFTLKDISGKEVRLADYKGKVLLLDFWATWCGPCKVEIPGFIDLYNTYKSQGLEVVGVVLLDKFENARPFARDMKINYPVLNGDEQQDAIDNAYGPLFGLPMSFIISRDGRICQKHLGLPGATATTSPDEKTVKGVFEAQIKALL